MMKIAQDIYWTGAIDWDLRNFHGYSTPLGSTYNAYLICDEYPTLIDTVKECGAEEMLRRIREHIDPAQIRYIISNHTEMDHSGTIDVLLAHCPQAEVVCSPKGAEGLRRHFKKPWKFKVVNTGDTLSIGTRTLQFVLMPMVHWPDSMATYCPQDAILFSNDAFGQHYAGTQRFVDEAGRGVIMEHAAKYYANIVMPYGSQVMKVLDALATIPVAMICPSHGLIWRQPEDIRAIVAQYRSWAGYESRPEAVIIYDTMWHSTERMAQYLAACYERQSVPVRLMNLKVTDYSDAVTAVMRSKIVCIGSAILNNRMLPSIGGFMTYLKGLKPKNRYGAVFGSYGWATIGFKELEQSLSEAGIEMVVPGTYVQYIPDEQDLTPLDAVARALAEKIAS